MVFIFSILCLPMISSNALKQVCSSSTSFCVPIRSPASVKLTKSVNSTSPRFWISPIFPSFNCVACPLTSAFFNAATSTSNKHPPDIIPAKRSHLFLSGSVSALRFINMITNRNSTMMAPAYTIRLTIPRNCALSKI